MLSEDRTRREKAQTFGALSSSKVQRDTTADAGFSYLKLRKAPERGAYLEAVMSRPCPVRAQMIAMSKAIMTIDHTG